MVERNSVRAAVFVLGAMIRYFATGIVPICLASRFLTVRSFLFAYLCGGTFIREVAYWLHLQPLYLLFILPCRFVCNMVVFCFVLPSQSILFLLCFRLHVYPSCGPAEYINVLKDATALARSGVLLPMRTGMHAFVAAVILLFVLQGSQFNFKEAYVSYDRSCDVEWEDEVSHG